MAILKEAEAGMPVKNICRKYGIGNSTFYKWHEKYGIAHKYNGEAGLLKVQVKTWYPMEIE